MLAGIAQHTEDEAPRSDVPSTRQQAGGSSPVQREKELRFHDLRRACASILIRGGCEAPYVAQQLGHSVEIL